MDQSTWQAKMDAAMPHGPDEPCTCDGCHNGETGCTGRTPECTCDIDWGAAAELDRDRPGRGLTMSFIPPRGLPTDPAERLRMAAAGRRVYARGCPNEHDREILEAQAAAYETAARILTDDVLLELIIPSWSFDVPAAGEKVIDE